MGVGAFTPTPNFIRAEATQNTSYTYTADEYTLEQMLDNYQEGFALDKWTSNINGNEEFSAAAHDKPHIEEIEQGEFYINGYYGTITQDQYDTMTSQSKWQYSAGSENVAFFVFSENGTTVKSNATITINYQSNLKYYGCKWVSRISLYYTTSDLLDDLYQQAQSEAYFSGFADALALKLDLKANQYATIHKEQAQDYGTYGIIESGSLLIWPEPAEKELTLNVTLSYGYETKIFVILETHYVETTSTEYGYIYSNGHNTQADNGIKPNIINSATLNYFVPASSITMEYIDLPNMMFNILTMPFAFISQAFDLTLFPGTQYALNISNLFLAIIGIAVFIWILKKVLKT